MPRPKGESFSHVAESEVGSISVSLSNSDNFRPVATHATTPKGLLKLGSSRPWKTQPFPHQKESLISLVGQSRFKRPSNLPLGILQTNRKGRVGGA